MSVMEIAPGQPIRSKANGPQPPQDIVDMMARPIAAMKHENEELKKQVERLVGDLTVARVELETVKGQFNAMEKRVATYQLERDQSAAQLGAYKHLFKLIHGETGRFIDPAPDLERAASEPETQEADGQ